jgi:hypothetical protein
MNKNIRIISILIILVAFIVVGAGCTSLSPDDYIPKSITPLENGQRFQGSVNVQIDFPNVFKSKFYDSQLMQILNITNISYGRIHWNDDNYNGYLSEGSWRSRASMNNREISILREAIEKAITKKVLFQQIEQGGADYVLDVWIIDIFRSPEAATVSNEMFITSIWRLTRVKDGKVIICDFARGHGKWGGSIEKAIQDMIQNGLMILSDPSMPLNAVNVAGYWPSKGVVVPEGYLKFKENWSKLQKGMTVEEVSRVISSPSLSLTKDFPELGIKSLEGPFSPYNNYNFTYPFMSKLNETCAIQRTFDITNMTMPSEIFIKRAKPINIPCGWIISFQEPIPPIETSPEKSPTTIFTNFPFIVPMPKVIYEPFYPFYHLTFVKNGSWIIRETPEEKDFKYKIFFNGDNNWVLESYELGM